MMLAPSTNYLPVVYLPNDAEKYRKLEHHRRFGICPASRYQAMPAEFRPAHPQPLRNLQVKKSQPIYFWKRLTFIGYLFGRLSAC